MTLLSHFQWDRIPFNCWRPCPASSGVNGNEKIIDLCGLCALSEARYAGQAGGEKYALTCPQSKAGTISIAEGLMD